MSVKTVAKNFYKFGLLFLLLISIIPFAFSSTFNDVHFTNGSSSAFPGTTTIGAEVVFNFQSNNTLVYNKAGDNTSAIRLMVFAGNTSLLANVTPTYNNSANQYYYNISTILFNTSQRYGFILWSTSQNTRFVNSNEAVVGNNLNYTRGSFYSASATTYQVYANTQIWGFDSITSTRTSAPPGTNATFTAVNYYNGSAINSFCVNITGNFTCTTNGTATVTTILTNSTQLWTVEYRSNESGGYFNTTYTGVNVSSTVNRSMAQSVVNFFGQEKVTGNNLTGFTFSSRIGSTFYLANATHYMANGTYNVTADKSGYSNTTLLITPTLLTTTNQNFSGLSNQTLVLRANNGITSASLTTFNVTISNSTYSFSETYQVTNGSVNIPLTSNINYSISVASSNYIGNSTTFFNASSGISYINISMYANNHLLFYFYDEDTLLNVTSVNWQLIGSAYSQNGTTSNVSNLANVSSLNVDDYELRYWRDNYTYRSLFFTVPVVEVNGTVVNAYMLNDSRDSAFVVTVTDKNNRPISQNLVVDILRRYALNGATYYYVVEMTRPTITLRGSAPFTAVPNNIPYLFRVRNYDTGEVLFQGSGTTSTNLETIYLIDSQFFIKINLEADPFEAAKDLSGVSYSLTNTTSAFWLSVTDSQNALSQFCLRVIANRTNTLSNNCSTSDGIVGVSFNPTNGSYYVAQFIATATADGKQYLVDNIEIDLRSYDRANWGYFGLFLLLLTLIAIGIGFQEKPVVGVVMGGMAFLLFGLSTVGSLWYTATPAVVGGSLFVVSIIIAFIMDEYN